MNKNPHSSHQGTLIALSMFLLCLILTGNWAGATHNRAGEITYRQISNLTFEFTVTTFTYRSPFAADRDKLEVKWGDGTFTLVDRVQIIELPDFYRKNIYISTHTFPGPGIYDIVMEDPNRNFGVLNIPNSVNTVFSIKTTMLVSAQLGGNNTPVLLNYPIDKGSLYRPFIHNPAAYDPDGDSLSYKLTICTRENGIPIENYTFPRASNQLYVDPVKGDLVWDAPMDTGLFNIAIDVEEWRKGFKIGNIVRDMQIEIVNAKNQPPVNSALADTCVIAGDVLELSLTSTDPDGDIIVQSMTGGPFAVSESPATFAINESKPGYSMGTFRWQTTCDHVQSQPYIVVLKAEDQNPEVKLVDIDNLQIRVIGPPPLDPVTTPASNAILVSWTPPACNNVSHYEIYRKQGSFNGNPGTCETGVHPDWGYTRVGSSANSQFLDNNQGMGLSSGIDYCYRVVAVFPDGSLGVASKETCSRLVPGLPALLKASVQEHGTNGSILLAWAKPLGLDTIPATGPYEYRVYRSPELYGSNFQLIHTFETSNLDDTTYLDSPLNTLIFPYSYRIELYNNQPGNRFLIGLQEIASSSYPALVGKDNLVEISFSHNVPWQNTSYTVYRKTSQMADFDSIATVDTPVYIDRGLNNGTEYCYKFESEGWRLVGDKTYTTRNVSHIACTIPVDSIPPCPPLLQVSVLCEEGINQLSWELPDETCMEDIIQFRVYLKHALDAPMTLLTTLQDPWVREYTHHSTEKLAACYYITSIDSVGNESAPSLLVCKDECSGYELPNVFSPNGDNVFDIYVAYNAGNNVKQVDMKIYNRWGRLVHQTNDPGIHWDGRHKDTGKIVPTGVYYYTCDVYEPRLTGIEKRNIVGFIQVYSDPGGVLQE